MSNYNIYCDESCHLENDHQQVMVLGAVWCPTEKVRDICKEIRAIKAEHQLSPKFEIKWTKVSIAKIDFYTHLINYFFDNDDLHFRGLVIPDKSLLDHEVYNQNHDSWYYKMYFDLLKIIITPDDCFFIYLDIKDTHGAKKIRKLHDVLCNNQLDFERAIIQRLQLVRSHEIEILQLTDLLIGAIGYLNRGLKSNEGKTRLIDLIKEKSGYSLTKTTLVSEEKFNLFVWKAGRLDNAR